MANVEYNKITGGGDDPPNIEVTTAAADVYKCTYTEGEKTKTYIMPIATLDIDDESQVGDLNWDLAPLGLLENGATYTISFVVWPDQEAYNYVADLNNGKKQWDRRFEIEVTDKNGKKYYKNGIFDSEDNPLYPNIVCYRDETTGEETFAVLTNTMQEVTYYIADEISGEETTYQYGETDPGTPPPMPLVHSKSKVEKRWSVDRDPGQLAQLLYDSAGNSKYFTIGFDVYQDVVPVTDPPTSGEDDPDTPPESDPSTGGEEDPETQPQPYTTFELGWIGDHETGQYVWDPDGQILTVTYGTATHEIGTSWNQEFSIAAGIMLSHTQMLERGLDTAAYPSGLFNGSSEPYYILEPGHDYRIVENTQLGYEFDKVNPVYHPMLVDGVLQNVNYEKLAGFDTPTADAHEIEITSMSSETGGIDALKITNTLRGYINLQKIVVDKDGKTELKDDNTKFTYQIDLTSPTNPGPFVDDHIPWYGVNGLFYHDDDFNYYQAVEDDPETNHLTLTTEAGKTYDAYCADPDSVFDDDIVGPTHIYYYTNPDDTATRVDIEHLFGNQMTCNDSSHASATIEISRTEILNISNVPVETEYTIKEVQETGYDLISIVKEIRNGDNVETRTRVNDLSTGTITGTIVPDRDNHIIFTNKIHSVDITVKKFDENEMPMSGAVFTLTKAKSGDETEDTVYTLPGAGETDAAVYRFTDLPDGSYTLHETAPEGYAGIGDVTFTVADGMISSMGTLPAGVTWDNKTLTFTVVNTPSPELLTVRKQWLDFFGNATNYNGTLDLTLTQWVPGDPPEHTVRVYLRCTGNGSGGGLPAQITSIADRSWTGSGDALFSWDWNGYTAVSADGGDASFDVDVPAGVSYEPYTTTEGVSYRMDGNVPKGKRQYVKFTGITKDIIVYITIRNNRYSGIDNPGSNVHQIRAAGPDPVYGPLEPSGGTKTVRLGTGGRWSQSFTIDGDGLLSDASTKLPATYTKNGKTKPCYYSISEDDIPTDYILQQISTDKIHSGALIAYNRRTTVDLVVEKVDENDDSIRLNGATFELRQLDPAKEGSMDMRSLDGGKTETKTTSGEGSNKGKLSFDSLGQGIYEIKETIVPNGYILESDSAFYIRVNESDVQLLQKDESKPASEWRVITGNKLLSLENATVTVGNTKGAALPNSGGPGTRLFTILGTILIAGAGLLMWRKRRLI